LDPDLLLEEISKISRGGVHRLEPGEARDQLQTLAHKVNQLVDHICMGGALPRHFTWQHELAATVAKRTAKQAGC
jgi:hypothetical protein